MLETSKDLLYVVISFSVLWLTVFLCWMIYYVAMLLKQVYDLVKSFKEKLEKVEGLIEVVKNKIEKSSSHLAIVAEGVGQLVKYLIEKKISGSSKKSAKRKK